MDEREVRMRQIRQQIQNLEYELTRLEQESAQCPPRPTPPYVQQNQQVPPYRNQTPFNPSYPFVSQPMPPVQSVQPSKKKNWEINFGRNILGILASALVFIGVMLLTYASGSKLGQLLGIFAAGIFLTIVGVIGSKKSQSYRTSFLSISGCGAGVLYIGILLAYWYYQLIPALIMYVLFLFWAGFMYLLSRNQPAVFRVIGHVGLVISVFSQLGETVELDASGQVMLLCLYFLCAALFYLFINRSELPKKHSVTVILNSICVLALEWKLFLLPFEAHMSTACCALLLAAFLLFQYAWEMRRWLQLQKASDRLWFWHYFPTLLLLFALVFLILDLDRESNWLLQTELLIFAVSLLAFWILAQKNRMATIPYKLTFVCSVMLSLFLICMCDPLVRLIGWCMFLAALALFGMYKKTAFCVQVAYGLFLFTTWTLLPDLFSYTPAWAVLVYSFVFFTLFNCGVILLCRYIRPNVKLYVLTQVGNCIAVLCSWMLLGETLTLSQRIWAAIAVTMAFTVNSGCYFQPVYGRNRFLEFLFGFKHVLLIFLLIRLLDISSVFLVAGWCALALVYTLVGFWRKNQGIRLSGWLLLLFTMLILILDIFSFGMSYAEKCGSFFLCAAFGYGILYGYHRLGMRQFGITIKLTKNYLVFPSAFLLLRGISILHRIYLPVSGQILFAPLLSVGLLVLGWLGMRIRNYRNFFSAVSGTGLAVLFLSIMLYHQTFSGISLLTVCIMFLLWVGLTCFFAQKRPDVFQPIAAAGIFLSVCLLTADARHMPVILALRDAAYATNEEVFQIGMNGFFVVLYFVLGSALLLLSVRREKLRYPVVVMIAHGLSIAVLLMLLSAEMRNTYTNWPTENLWYAIQLGLLLTSVLFQYYNVMCQMKKRQCASDKLWMICYLPALAQLLLLLLYWCFSSWNTVFGDESGLFHSCLSFYVSALLLLMFWFSAQSRRMPTVIYQMHFYLTILSVAFALCAAPQETKLFRLGAWIILLGILSGVGLWKRMAFYWQTAYGLMVFGTWIILLPFLEKMAFRQTFCWLVSTFTLLNCLGIVLCRRFSQRDSLHWVSQVFNWLMMPVGSILLMLNLDGWFFREAFLLSLPEKLLLAAAVTASYLVGSGQLIRIQQNQVTTGRELLFGLKHMVLVLVLFCGFEMPGVFLSIGFLLLAVGYIVLGFWKNKKTIRVFGLVLVMVSVCKLILLDISYERLVLRACSFLLCAALCFGISFIYNRMSPRLKQWEQK